MFADSLRPGCLRSVGADDATILKEGERIFAEGLTSRPTRSTDYAASTIEPARYSFAIPPMRLSLFDATAAVLGAIYIAMRPFLHFR